MSEHNGSGGWRPIPDADRSRSEAESPGDRPRTIVVSIDDVTVVLPANAEQILAAALAEAASPPVDPNEQLRKLEEKEVARIRARMTWAEGVRFARAVRLRQAYTPKPDPPPRSTGSPAPARPRETRPRRTSSARGPPDDDDDPPRPAGSRQLSLWKAPPPRGAFQRHCLTWPPAPGEHRSEMFDAPTREGCAREGGHDFQAFKVLDQDGRPQFISLCSTCGSAEDQHRRIAHARIPQVERSLAPLAGDHRNPSTWRRTPSGEWEPIQARWTVKAWPWTDAATLATALSNALTLGVRTSRPPLGLFDQTPITAALSTMIEQTIENGGGECLREWRCGGDFERVDFRATREGIDQPIAIELDGPGGPYGDSIGKLVFAHERGIGAIRVEWGHGYSRGVVAFDPAERPAGIHNVQIIVPWKRRP